MGPDIVGFETSAPLAIGVTYYTPITIPAGSYVLNINLLMSTVSSAGYVSFAIYTSNDSSRIPYGLVATSMPVPISSQQPLATYSFASPGFQNSTTTTLWVAFSFSPGTAGYFTAIAPDQIVVGPYIADFVTPGSGVQTSNNQQSPTYTVTQTYNVWPSVAPTGGSFGGGNLGQYVPFVYFGH
jgi:hypothetical protein